MSEAVLTIEDLHLSFPIFRGEVHALNHVSLEIKRGEIVGVVGESGSGKSVTAMLTMRLLPEGSYRVHRGQVKLLGEDVLNASEKQLRQWRGAKVAMIFQEPMTALNPTRRIGKQMVEVIRQHQPLSRRDAGKKRSPCWKRCRSRMRRRSWNVIRSSCPVACASGDDCAGLLLRA